MLKDQCISVTDLRKKTTQCLNSLEGEPKYIFINNKPVAVLIDIFEYEEKFLKPELVELREDEVDEFLRKKATHARKSRKKDLLSI